MTDPSTAMVDGLNYLATEIVVTRDRALKGLHPRGDMLLDGMVNKGYAQQARDDGRYGLTAMGHRALQDLEPQDNE